MPNRDILKFRIIDEIRWNYMENGILFYWFSWILWIIVTFFMRKGRQRLFFASCILISIIGTSFTITIYSFTISFTYIVLFLYSLVILAKHSNHYKLLFYSATISICYTALLIWEKISPVWMIFPRIIMIAFIIGVLAILLCNEYLMRIIITVFGLVVGEMLYSFIWYRYGVLEEVGDFLFLDTLFSLLLLLMILAILQKGRQKVTSFLNQYKQSMRWQAK